MDAKTFNLWFYWWATGLAALYWCSRVSPYYVAGVLTQAPDKPEEKGGDEN